jgi:hypothetical protein
LAAADTARFSRVSDIGHGARNTIGGAAVLQSERGGDPASEDDIR